MQVAVCSDSGFAAAYCVAANPFGFGGELRLMRINAAAESLWTKQYDDAQLEPAALIETPDGGFLIVVNSIFQEFPLIPTCSVVLRTDVHGDTIWTRQWKKENPAGLHFTLGLQCANGDFMILGHFWNATAHGIMLLRITDEGREVWSCSYPNHNAYDFAETATGDFLIIGSASTCASLFCVSETGDSLWYKKKYEYWHDRIFPRADGMFTVLLHKGNDVFVGQMDVSGDRDLRGDRCVSHMQFPVLTTLFAQTSLHGYVAVNIGQSVFRRDLDYCVTATDSLGIILWRSRCGTGWDDIPKAIEPASNGGCLIAGACNGNLRLLRLSAK
jgi:hypothetical protein